MGRKPNYSFEKKQREKAKADKREAKRQAKLAAKAAAAQPAEDKAAPDDTARAPGDPPVSGDGEGGSAPGQPR